MEVNNRIEIDFDDTTAAFERKSNWQLSKTKWLFYFLKYPIVVKMGSFLALFAIRLRLPFFKSVVKNTMFEHFCGGETLEECIPVIDSMAKQNVKTVLDYGAEGKETHEDFFKAYCAFDQALDFSANNPNIPVISIKLTALFSFSLLENVSQNNVLNATESQELTQGKEWLDLLGNKASQYKKSIFIDAEESWIQKAIDEIAGQLMNQFNRDFPVFYNTFQMYRHDRFDFLKASVENSKQNGYILGAKLVRGAYMEKERARAAQYAYPDPIQRDKAATDYDFNAALAFLMDHLDLVAIYNASHNRESNDYLAKLVKQRNMAPSHPHINFSQLYGMSDDLTYNLSKHGFNASKYMVYGPVYDVIPYLIRRAQENTSVTGEVGRELKLINREQTRRKNNLK